MAHNIALWLRTLPLPRAVRRARGKRLRLALLNVAARLVRHGRRLHLRFGAAYPHVEAFTNALHRIWALPAFGLPPPAPKSTPSQHIPHFTP